MSDDGLLLGMLVVVIGGAALSKLYASLGPWEAVGLIISSIGLLILIFIFLWERFSKYARDNRKRLEKIREIPSPLLLMPEEGVRMGDEIDLRVPIFLPDSVRSRHIHIIGATGSGKTESVVLNFLKQDVERNYGAIILDAKGDASFFWALTTWVPKQKLKVFDLGAEDSLTYDPLFSGSPLEASQRLFSSLTWSEEYYKSKALSVLQRLFQYHFQQHKRNPRLIDLQRYLETPANLTATSSLEGYPDKLAEKDFAEISGLRDQIGSLCVGHLSSILSPQNGQMNLKNAVNGDVLYFRLQSLLSPQMVATLGKLIINHLNFLAATAHREKEMNAKIKLVPIYLDEFASFACLEFADLISKARSAGFALHFSHQSIGDLADVAEGFLNRITDNSATKIVMRINDPDSADFFARSFGTRLYSKFTQRVTNAEETDLAEVLSEGTQREAHQFRAPPDLLKTLPTGVGSVLIAHGCDTPHGASTVFKIKFPKL